MYTSRDILGPNVDTLTKRSDIAIYTSDPRTFVTKARKWNDDKLYQICVRL